MKRGTAIQSIAQGALGCALIAPAAGASAATIEGLRNIQPEAVRPTQDLVARGRLHLASGDLPRALEMYRQALGRDPNSVEALNGVAVCYDRLGKFDVSRTYYEIALGIDPQSPMLLNNYGYSRLLQGDHAGAQRFLSLAAASGEPEVVAASLRLLARVEAARPEQLAAAPARTPDALPAAARIVRTSSHEQRLMLGGDGAAPPMMIATLGEAAAAVVEVAAVSDVQDRAIVAVEADLQTREARQLADAEAAPAQGAALRGPDWATIHAAPAAPHAAGTDFAGFATPAPPHGPRQPGGYAGHVLGQGRLPSSSITSGRAGPLLAALPSGLIVQRQAARPPLATTLPAAEPLMRKRSFDMPFESDDIRLNGFAAEVHGRDSPDRTAAQLALLEDLIERMRTA